MSVLMIVLVVLAAWLLAAVLLAFAFGRMVQLADRDQNRRTGTRPVAVLRTRTAS